MAAPSVEWALRRRREERETGEGDGLTGKGKVIGCQHQGFLNDRVWKKKGKQIISLADRFIVL